MVKMDTGFLFKKIHSFPLSGKRIIMLKYPTFSLYVLYSIKKVRIDSETKQYSARTRKRSAPYLQIGKLLVDDINFLDFT